ncbi:hypothetical protein, partial [Thiorhodococcus minor]|uniref:hypothetical protein n=1 Tax=Thiorhodococcus minor TaxID=57489 RepID=UPI001ADB4275
RGDVIESAEKFESERASHGSSVARIGQEARPDTVLRDHQRWPNAFFAAQGLFTLTTAHAQASQSR